MPTKLGTAAVASVLLIAIWSSGAALAQKRGGMGASRLLNFGKKRATLFKSQLGRAESPRSHSCGRARRFCLAIAR